MALIKSDPSLYPKISPPHEPESWFVVRPLTAKDIREAANSGAESEIDLAFNRLPMLLLAWSYEDEITPETVDQLDAETLGWLLDAIKQASKIRGDDEKKDFPSSSPPPSQGEETEPSPANSPISRSVIGSGSTA